MFGSASEYDTDQAGRTVPGGSGQVGPAGERWLARHLSVCGSEVPTQVRPQTDYCALTFSSAAAPTVPHDAPVSMPSAYQTTSREMGKCKLLLAVLWHKHHNQQLFLRPQFLSSTLLIVYIGIMTMTYISGQGTKQCK
eukprot:scaffold68347_cov23-Prasinocladus_malaysianus.AAC.1